MPRPLHDVQLSRCSCGLDVSHKCGNPGFVQSIRADDASPVEIMWPEYNGNKQFLTLGNLLQDPRAGLMIPDYETGAVVQMTGNARLVMNDAARLYHPSASRVVVFAPSHCILREYVIPVYFEQLDSSPNVYMIEQSPLIVTPLKAIHRAQAFPMARLVDKVSHSDSIASFTFETVMMDKLAQHHSHEFVPGQFVTLGLAVVSEALSRRVGDDTLTRCWTVTSCPKLNCTFLLTHTHTLTHGWMDGWMDGWTNHSR